LQHALQNSRLFLELPTFSRLSPFSLGIHPCHHRDVVVWNSITLIGRQFRTRNQKSWSRAAVPSKASIAGQLPIRRGLDEREAAVYLPLSPSFFRRLVARALMPRPRVIGRRRIWDVDDLDLAFKALPREPGGVMNFELPAVDADSWSDYQ
jgi:hypothetical protein